MAREATRGAGRVQGQGGCEPSHSGRETAVLGLGSHDRADGDDDHDARPDGPLTAPADTTPLPFRIGSPAEFTRLREFLVASGYTFDELARREQRLAEAKEA